MTSRMCRNHEQDEPEDTHALFWSQLLTERTLDALSSRTSFRNERSTATPSCDHQQPLTKAASGLLVSLVDYVTGIVERK